MKLCFCVCCPLSTPHPLLTEHAKDVSRYEVNGSLSDSQAKSILSYRREPSYFEIPTKELQQRPHKKPEMQLHEAPTKDTSDPTQCVLSTPTPPVVQSHASFTIEFDECTPGKMKIKDHVTKFSYRQPPNLPPSETVTTPTEVMSAESKVADWLVQSNATMTRRRSQAEDMYSSNSDPIIHSNKGECIKQSMFHSNSTDFHSNNELNLELLSVLSFISKPWRQPPEWFWRSSNQWKLSAPVRTSNWLQVVSTTTEGLPSTLCNLWL